MAGKKFNWRAFTSLYITLSFLIMVLSGIILFIAPPGRIANWTDLTILYLTKAQWQAIHTIFTFLFIIASSFHIYFNWKPLMAYLRNKLNNKIRLRNELLFSALLTILIFYLISINIHPFKAVMDIGKELSNNLWIDEPEPPLPHAELMTLDELAQAVQIPIQDILLKLEREQIIVQNANILIRELAQKNKLSPQQLYSIIMGNTNSSQGVAHIEGSGYGRMTVNEICSKYNIPLKHALNRLNARGIKASPDSQIRTLARKHDKRPIEIIRIVQKP